MDLAELTIEQLAELDSKGYRPILAITPAGISTKNPNTFASPLRFICEDGKVYWVKGSAQKGLSAELISGRLAHLVGAGPIAEIVNVPENIFGLSGSDKEKEGIRVGIADVPNSDNLRVLQGNLSEVNFDNHSRALTTVFQTWICATDNQVLVDETKGIIRTIDHGEAFGDLNPQGIINVVHLELPGVPLMSPELKTTFPDAIRKITQVSNQQIMEAVSRIPDGDKWNGAQEYRYSIYGYLKARRDLLEEVFNQWLRK